MKNFILLINIFATLLTFGCSKDENPSQPQNGSIQGKVTNSTDSAPVIGASVQTTPPTSVVSTNSNGDFIINDVPTGIYSLTVIKSGFATNSVNISVVSGKTTNANVQLNPSSSSTTIFYNENFDTCTVNKLPSGWAEFYSGDGSSAVTTSQSYSAPNSFKIGCLTSWDGCYDYYISNLNLKDNIVVSFKFKGDPNTHFRPIFYFRVNGKEYGGGYDPSRGKLGWIDGTSGFVGSTITKGVWYSVEMRINKSTNLVSYYLNGSLEKSACVGSSGATLPNDGIRLYSANGGNGTIYYDDILITGN